MDNPVYKLLIVEDDLGIAQAIQTQASLWNFDVRIVENFRDVTGEVTSFSPHIILLDITLPFFNGYHWCSEIRKFSISSSYSFSCVCQLFLSLLPPTT